MLSYVALLLLFVSIGAVYCGPVLPHLAPRCVSLSKQTLGLELLALGLFGAVFVFALLLARGESFGLWWWTGRPITLLGVVLGIGVYASSTVYGRIRYSLEGVATPRRARKMNDLLLLVQLFVLQRCPLSLANDEGCF